MYTIDRDQALRLFIVGTNACLVFVLVSSNEYRPWPTHVVKCHMAQCVDVCFSPTAIFCVGVCIFVDVMGFSLFLLGFIARGQVEKLSMHAYGCRVIQRILEHCIDEQKQVILEEIKDSFSVLIQVCTVGTVSKSRSVVSHLMFGVVSVTSCVYPRCDSISQCFDVVPVATCRYM